MRRNFILLAACFGLSFIHAQTNTIPLPDSNLDVNRIKGKERFNQSFDLTTLNRAKPLNNTFDLNDSSILSNQPRSSAFNVTNDKNTQTPFASIQVNQWSIAKNVDTDESIFFEMDYKFGDSSYVGIKIYDDNLKIEKQFKVDIPSSANSVSVMNDFSSKLIDGQNKLLIPIYVHYFEGGQGPSFQIDEIWLISEDGEIVDKQKAIAAFIRKGDNGELSYFTLDRNDAVNTFTKVDLKNSHNSKSFISSSELSLNYSGLPLEFNTVDGQSAILLIHYEKKFMNNSTLEYTKDNHLVFNVLDYDLNLIREVKVPNLGYDDSNPYVFPMATYGLFYNSNKYNFTNHTFNDDDQFEVVYGSFFYDFINDEEWYNFYLVNQDGKILKKIDDKVVYPGSEMGIQIQEIEGQNDQVVMLIGEQGGVSFLKTFDLPSFEMVQNFPALYNDDLLSFNFNRIPVGNSYEYLIGLSYMEKIDEELFGVINQYNKMGKLTKRQRLSLERSAVQFTPYLMPSTLNPYLINDDDAIEYMYRYKKELNGQATNVFNIASDENTIIASFTGDSKKGNLVSSGYLTNRKGNIDRLFMGYDKKPYTSEFYKIPFENLEINEQIIQSNKIIYLKNTKELVFNYEYKNYMIYGIDGRLLNSGTFNKSIAMNGLTKGIYVVKTIAANGHITTAKIVVH